MRHGECVRFLVVMFCCAFALFSCARGAIFSVHVSSMQMAVQSYTITRIANIVGHTIIIRCRVVRCRVVYKHVHTLTHDAGVYVCISSCFRLLCWR